MLHALLNLFFPGFYDDDGPKLDMTNMVTHVSEGEMLSCPNGCEAVAGKVVASPILALLQSKPYKMFAATLQPSLPSRRKTNVTLLFYFLKHYNFGLNEIFVRRINQF